jgi:hypothetical protein
MAFTHNHYCAAVLEEARDRDKERDNKEESI